MENFGNTRQRSIRDKCRRQPSPGYPRGSPGGHPSGLSNKLLNGVPNGFSNSVPNEFSYGVPNGFSNGVPNGLDLSDPHNGFHQSSPVSSPGFSDDLYRSPSDGPAHGLVNCPHSPISVGNGSTPSPPHVNGLSDLTICGPPITFTPAETLAVVQASRARAHRHNWDPNNLPDLPTPPRRMRRPSPPWHPPPQLQLPTFPAPVDFLPVGALDPIIATLVSPESMNAALQAGAYEFYPPQPQGPLNSYQAYGSAPNDLRGASSQSGRGAQPATNLAQSTPFFQQSGHNMRPPQPAQGGTPQQYFISQPNVRPQRQTQPTAMVFLQQPYPANNNVVMAANMPYPPRMPTMYGPNTAYLQHGPHGPMALQYLSNGANMRAPSPGVAPTQPRPRERRMLEITDPDTGKSITSELLNQPQSSEGDDSESARIEIRQEFTRQVAERMKDESNSGAALEGAVGATVGGAVGGPLPTSHEHNQPQYPSHHQHIQHPQQPPPPQQPQPQSQPAGQHPPTSMIRPGLAGPPQMLGAQGSMPHHMMTGPPRQGMMQHPPPSATPPEMSLHGQRQVIPNMNLSVPPPPVLRQPTPAQVYNPLPQQQQQQHSQGQPPHHPPRHQQSGIRPQIGHGMGGGGHPPSGPTIAPQQMATTPAAQPQPQVQAHPHTHSIPQQQQQQPQSHPPASLPPPVTASRAIEVLPPDVKPKPLDSAPAPVSSLEDNIPPKPAPVVAQPLVQPPVPVSAPTPTLSTPSPPVEEKPQVLAKEESPEKTSAPPQAEPQPQPVAAKETSPDSDKSESSTTSAQGPTEETIGESVQAGASSSVQGKDGRKGKKNKKEYNRKDIAGSDMDAFIDFDVNLGNDTPEGEMEMHTTCVLLHTNGQQAVECIVGERRDVDITVTMNDLPNGQGDSAAKVCQELDAQNTGKGRESPVFENGNKEVEEDEEEEDARENGDIQKQRDEVLICQKVLPPAQVESKHKLKKKKKKKGKKSSPPQKVKPTLGNVEVNHAVEVSDLCEYGELASASMPLASGDHEDKENDITTEVDKPLPVTEHHNLASSPPPEKESSPPKPEALKEPFVTPTPPAEVKPTVAATVVTKQDVDVKEATPPAATPLKNQNQSESSSSASIRNARRSPGQPERQSSQPKEEAESAKPEEQLAPSTNGLPEEQAGAEENQENVPPVDNVEVEQEVEGAQAGAAAAVEEQQQRPAVIRVVGKDGQEKRQYDRLYLIKLRDCPKSQTKPENLPNIDIILDKPMPVPTKTTTTTPDFTPGFFQIASGTQRQHAPPMGKSSSRGRQRPGDMPMPGPQRVIKSVSLQNDLKPLHQSDNPWKPVIRATGGNPDQAEKKSLESEVLFIMNRLTPTNFERLAMEMRNLDIKTYEDLVLLVKIFFDKVTIETKFVQAYAELCKVMCSIKVPPLPNMKENQATFRVVMLTKCQQEFEADKSIVFEDPEEKKRKIAAESPDNAETAALIENTLYQMKMRRLKFYGNIRFIGELFKLGMLTENIMHDCIFRLLKARDDDSLVSLCNLITTVGQALDTEKAKGRMDQYFAQMAKIAEERKSRIKFTLKDAVDLRNNGWKPRKETTGPKKIDEVHKDYQQEQATKQYLNSQPPPPRNDVPQPGSRRGSRQRMDDGRPNDDGWNTVSSAKSFRIDAAKMRLSKQSVVDENTVQLGPGGGMNKFSMWSRGSHGGAQPSQDDRPAPAGNRFSALRNDEDRRNFQRSPSRGDGGPASRGMRQGPTAGHGRGKIMARGSTEGERRDALASARSIVGGGRSQNSSRDNSWNRDDRRASLGPRGSREGENPMTRSDISLRPNEEFRSPAIPPAKKVKEMTPEEMETKAKNILEEYLNIRDLEEAKLCVSELAGQPHLHLLVMASINDVIEGKDEARHMTGQYFHELVKHGVLSLDHYLKGLAEVLRFAEDIVIDIPKLWTYLAQIISPLLIGGSLPWSKLPSALHPYLDRRYSSVLVAEILYIACTVMDPKEVAQLWQSNGLEWTMFIEQDQVDQFLKDKKLEFMVNPMASAALPPRGPPSSAGQLSLTRVAADVEKMMRDKLPSNTIFSFIDKQVAKKDDKNFIRALMTAVLNLSINEGKILDEDLFKSQKDILQHYICRNPDLELQALYAIQALMCKLQHPKGVIVRLFELLYDDETISEETFAEWEKSSDPQEQEGKGACTMQVIHFIAWLKEGEEPEES